MTDSGEADADSDAMVLLHRTTAGGTSPADPLPFDGDSVLRRAGADDGRPFILGPDGSYDRDLNRFLRDLESWGVRAENSRIAYSTDVMLYCRFLHESRAGKSIWDTDGADLRAYKSVRLRGDGPGKVSAATWNRSIAALDKWVQWSLYEELLPAEPFRYIDKTVISPQGPKRVRVNADAEPEVPRQPIRFLSHEDFMLWRDVGLRGLLPNGSPDSRWRGRNGERNALFADLLICTGMRLGEAAGLLTAELPPVTRRRVIGDITVPAAVAKRNKARTVYARPRVVRDLHHYLAIERDELVQRRRAEGMYEAYTDRLPVRRANRHALAVEGGTTWSYSRIGTADRVRLVQVDGQGSAVGPLWLWLGENGLPLRSGTWQSVFRRANERCAGFGLDFDVHPHTLRHSFAVHMLGLLLRQTVRALGMREDRRFTHAEVKRLLIGNPLRKLQLLLGHRHEATVYTYLDVLDDAQEIVLAALDDWDEQAAAIEQIRLDAEEER
ncbi:tyrosine-type recombinase/integrase [Streptomyces sp. ISL-96]|uniref:tyrosine-type recombinase/integrase n=1 Tax=Streptomyces sp. ISL-96 TaxID=2819191 RepID=UPI001BE7D8DE|nr:tyrosine-type recombinase/integrase [Streptomyces sp. ISL-96]MBT2491823.1 tyrosine-type recombinase/integrase [Streptomyces sp. ISL-96]